MARLLELEEHPIRINARGEWLHGGERLHPKVEALFRRNVVPEGSGYVLQIEFRRAPIEVDDVAFFVTRTELVDNDHGALQRVDLWISDGIHEVLDPTTLMQSEDNVLYCRIRRGDCWVPCRFSSQQYHELGLRAEVDEAGAGLAVAGSTYRLAPYSRAAAEI